MLLFSFVDYVLHEHFVGHFLNDGASYLQPHTDPQQSKAAGVNLCLTYLIGNVVKTLMDTLTPTTPRLTLMAGVATPRR
jgi:hypothetical protein